MNEKLKEFALKVKNKLVTLPAVPKKTLYLLNIDRGFTVEIHWEGAGPFGQPGSTIDFPMIAELSNNSPFPMTEKEFNDWAAKL